MTQKGNFSFNDPNLPQSGDSILNLHRTPRLEVETAPDAIAAMERDQARAQLKNTYDQIMKHVVSEYHDMTAAREKRLRA